MSEAKELEEEDILHGNEAGFVKAYRQSEIRRARDRRIREELAELYDVLFEDDE